MIGQTRLTSKGQIVLPKPVRDKLRWRPGTQIRVETLRDGSVRLLAEETDPIEAAFGFLTFGDPLGDLEADHRREIKADERRRPRR